MTGSIPKRGKPVVLGPRGRAVLNALVAHGGSYTAQRNAERDGLVACEARGLARRDRRDNAVFHLTQEGVAYHRRLLQAH